MRWLIVGFGGGRTGRPRSGPDTVHRARLGRARRRTPAETAAVTGFGGHHRYLLLHRVAGLGSRCQRGSAAPDGCHFDRRHQIACLVGAARHWTQLLFTARTMPAYLDNDWDRDWGSIEQFIPLDPTTRPATITRSDVQRSGTWTTGHIITSY
ncbi:arabinosyltransferase C-terminal domain-containing protein [Nocardia araoensis]|uniref:arabinosyltransferase C-terminal domain-containing protein n=1 Tax=Nocardia araoensis TaxID=228600 RepID=UPI00278BF60A|nr:arabinosyltransferase C-terminal domain-containing protein [Nocardia araoensis]